MGGNLKGRCNTESKIAVLLVVDAGIYSWHNIALILISISTPDPAKVDFNSLAELS
jgi:hypothetical protein